MNNQPIGVLDSGVGGLSIWKELVRELPYESIIYAADSKNCPYGSKSSEEIYSLAKKLVQFLVDKKCKLIVIACNTITVSCLDKLREEFPKIPIIGTVPVVKTGVEKTHTKKIGILSTTATAKSEYQLNLIKKFAQDVEVVNEGTDVLVPLIEEGKIEGKRIARLLKDTLKIFTKARIDVLALGCSHFPFLKTHIQKILGDKVLILDSGAAIARQVRRILQREEIESLSKTPSFKFYSSGDQKSFRSVARKLVEKRFRDTIRDVKKF